MAKPKRTKKANTPEQKSTPVGLYRFKLNERPKKIKTVVPQAFIDLGTDWQDAVNAMAAGLGVGQGVGLNVPAESLQKYSGMPSYIRPFKEFVESHYGHKYVVSQRKRREGGYALEIFHPLPLK